MTYAWIFPGQGSQSVGMGRTLADESAAARRVFEEADDILGFSISALCWDGPQDALTATEHAQPALLTHSIAALEVGRERIGPPALAAGHSLGEFSAHVAAGTLEFHQALRAVRTRGLLMAEAGNERPGTMAAVLGLDADRLEEVCERVSESDSVCVPANYNSDGQIVISGDVGAVERAIEALSEAGARKVIRLGVSGAFHSPLMRAAQGRFASTLSALEFRDPKFPVVSNVTARPVTEGRTARRLLVEQLTSPVRWSQSLEQMAAHPVSGFVEWGPGKVLCGLARRIARDIPCTAFGESNDLESLDAFVSSNDP